MKYSLKQLLTRENENTTLIQKSTQLGDLGGLYLLMKKSLFSALVFMFCVFVVAKTSAITHTLIPTDDTYFGAGPANLATNFGMGATLKTYFFSGITNNATRQAYVKFDIRGISTYIESVKLRLYTPGIAAGGNTIHKFNIYPVSVNTWAEDGLIYSNYSTIAGAHITTPVLASYSVPLGGALAAGYIEFSDPLLTKIISDSIAKGCSYISFRLAEITNVRVGTAAQIVDFHSKENVSGNVPQLEIVEKNVEPYRASDIQADNVTLTDFFESTYRYLIRLSYTSTVVPTITATAKYPGTTTVVVTPAASLTGTEAARTTEVTMQSGGQDQLVYNIIFELLPPPTDAQLSDISVDGKSLEFFDKTKLAYTLYLPYSAVSVPVIAPVANDPTAGFSVTNAIAIDPVSTQQDRTTSILVTSSNGEVTKTYTVEFIKLPKLDIILAIGQSNMSGRAPFADVTAPMNDIFLLTPGAEMEMSSNPMNKYSNIRKDLSLQGLGPAYNCALGLREYFGKPFGFVVNAQGGSAIDLWYKPTKTNYDASLIRAKQAQRFGTIKAIIWHQGEADRVAEEAENPVFTTYKSKLAQMVTNFRTDLNEPDLYFVAGELYSGTGTEHTIFNTEVIRNVSSIVSNSGYVTTENLVRLSDNLHFDEPSVKILGSRYAEKLIPYFAGLASRVSERNINQPLVTATHEHLKIQNVNDKTTFSIYNLMGKLIRKSELMTSEIVEMHISSGVYLLQFTNPNSSFTFKIFVQ